jgi:hypothetical protein
LLLHVLLTNQYCKQVSMIAAEPASCRDYCSCPTTTAHSASPLPLPALASAVTRATILPTCPTINHLSSPATIPPQFQSSSHQVEAMAADIASMQQQVQQLEAERAALQLKHKVLQAAFAASDEVLNQMAALQVHPPTAATTKTTSSSSSSSTTGLGASTNDMVEALDSALVVVQGSGTDVRDVDWAEVMKRVEYKLQCNAAAAQQQAQQHSNNAAVAAAQRQKNYVFGTVQHVNHGLQLPANSQNQCSSTSPVSSAVHSSSSSSGYAAFPHGIADLLHLAQLQRSTHEPAGAVSSGQALMLHLETGESAEVPRSFWSAVAQQIPAPSSRQLRKLEALWEVYHVALDGLAQDREQLLTQLSDGVVGFKSSLRIAAAVEAYASRARAITLTYEWALQGMLTNEQVAKMCVTCWPVLPAVGAVVSNMLGRRDPV